MAETPKDTIYIDVDDEITTVIDRVSESNKKLVALVLPKRASVFQSIVNMKLLKRKSDEAGKNLVLVTNEAGLLPLAGAVGLHVAKDLASKPEIPAPPAMAASMVEAAEDEEIPTLDEASGTGSVDLKNMAEEPVGKLADGDTSPAKATAPKIPEDTILLDNTDEADKPTDTAMPAAAIAAADEAKKKAKKDKKNKIPNFERFRLISIISILVIVILVILWLLMFKVWPHATVDIKTNAQNVSADLTFNMDTSASSLNTSTNTIPAKEVSETKTYTATVNATGQQNNGQSATGSVTFYFEDCDNSTPPTIPAGTGIVQNNLTYITQASASVDDYQGIKNKCVDLSSGSTPTDITAQNPGSSYNTQSNSTTFSVPDYSTSTDTMTATGGASGGTDDIVTVVSQSDISNAESKISPSTSSAKSYLSNELSGYNYYPLSATFTAGSPDISPNATAGTAANSVTVTENIKYTMYGVIKSDLTTLLNDNIRSQVGSNQNILSNGLSSASYSIGSSPTNVTLASNAIVGPNINVTELKKELTGQKVNSIESIVKSNSNVSSVAVHLSPFYVSQAPSASHITINVAKPSTSNAN